MGYIEISAKSVDDAITKASLQLETSSDKLDIQVVSQGSSGFLGFGSKPAVIRVCKKEEIEVKKEVVKEIEKPIVKPVENKTENTKKEEVNKEVKKSETAKSPRTDEDIKEMEDAAFKFLDDVFKAMQLEVKIEMTFVKHEDSLDIEFSGEDMGILIGKRGQTLDSLQYLTNLVVNKTQQDYVRVKLDTENYRSRRRETLENLARNIAYKVKKTRKSVALEPMNPYERRIIHSALQGNKFVETYSEGSEPYRHVVVTIKK